MKDWMKDALIGLVSGSVMFIVFLIFYEGISVLSGILDIFFWPIFYIIAPIPGLLGGILGGRFLKFKYGNAVGGGVLALVVTLFIFFFPFMWTTS